MATNRPVDQRLPPGHPDALGKTTNIDRRTCRRTVPLEVLCLGLHRTGTCSLRQALLDLGYNNCYHMAALLNENPRDAEMWVEAYNWKYLGKGKPFTRKDWDQLLGHCMATTDSPTIAFGDELMEAYPDAKVILTVRDSADQWRQSYLKTLAPYTKEWVTEPESLAGRLVKFLVMHFGPLPSAVMHCSKLMVDYSGFFNNIETDGVRKYEEYNADIMRKVPKEKLLIFNVKEGWEPLCKFLGKDFPDYPFPRVNDTATFQQNHVQAAEVMFKSAIVNFTKCLGVVAVAGFGLWFAWKRRAIFVTT